MEGPSEKLDRQWGMVREAQRQAWHTLEHVTVVPAADLALYDFIHNASEGNLVVGNGAPAPLYLAECYGRDVDWMAPEPESVVQTAPDTVTVRFSRIRNWLNPLACPRPCSF